MDQKECLYIAHGTLTNNGTISMTARGAKAEGQNVYLFKKNDDSFEYVPKVGGAGGVIKPTSGNGFHGAVGQSPNIRRGTGGGGSGGIFTGGSNNRGYCTQGTSGTSYSGGTGGGGVYVAQSIAGSNGANGGNTWDSDDHYWVAGGAGNPARHWSCKSEVMEQVGY